MSKEFKLGLVAFIIGLAFIAGTLFGFETMKRKQEIRAVDGGYIVIFNGQEYFYESDE